MSLKQLTNVTSLKLRASHYKNTPLITKQATDQKKVPRINIAKNFNPEYKELLQIYLKNRQFNIKWRKY